jgi:hypothetical protein
VDNRRSVAMCSAGGAVSDGSERRGVGTAGAVGSAGAYWRPTAHDGHERSVQCAVVPAADGLSVEHAAEGFPPRSTVYNIFRQWGSGTATGIAFTMRFEDSCASRWNARPARAPASSTANRSNRPKKGVSIDPVG